MTHKSYCAQEECQNDIEEEAKDRPQRTASGTPSPDRTIRHQLVMAPAAAVSSLIHDLMGRDCPPELDRRGELVSLLVATVEVICGASWNGCYG